ncbi:hypothetical protein CRE_11492 [Caenorhabditis remanei]|uniref:Uncharacterized protein n=1 Tax=Caenorhabditis remanei TaxID=31234 RepID=E3NH30_CAERE|nr:hypothetical protein CRE_11492 [Caenorhabditis remanei]
MYRLLLLCVILCGVTNANKVEQVHLSLSGKMDEMVVTWLTQGPSRPSSPPENGTLGRLEQFLANAPMMKYEAGE